MADYYKKNDEDEKKRKSDEIFEKLEKGIKELFESDAYARYLQCMAKFHNYSFNNCLLIAMQNPEATLVAGYTDWEKKHKRHVKKGEKGISIIAPAPYKKQVEKEVIDQNGQCQIELQEVIIPSYKVTTVFDVSQTEGQELPSIGVDELEGVVEGYADIRKALEEVSPVPVTKQKIKGGAKGYFSPVEQKIVLKSGMAELQEVKTLIHEIAHAMLHNIEGLGVTKEQEALVKKLDETIATNMGEISVLDYLTIRAAEAGYDSYKAMRNDGMTIEGYEDITVEILELHDKLLTAEANRRTKEVQAESVAYAVSQHFGIDTSEYSFGYIAGWSSGKDTKELKESMNVIRKTTNQLITQVEQKLALIRNVECEVKNEAEMPMLKEECKVKKKKQCKM